MEPQMEVAAILSADNLIPFQTLIQTLMSSSNALRSHAESVFHLLSLHHPENLARNLSLLLHSSPLADIRAMSAVLLRKLLTSSSSSSYSSYYLYPRLSPQSQSTLKSTLLLSLHREDSKSISKKLCHAVSDLASSLLPENAWPELLPFLFQSVGSSSPKLQESALLIFTHLARCVGDVLVPHLLTLHSVFLRSLSHPTWEDVRIAGLGAAINFIQCLESAGDRDRFQDLLPVMMGTLTESLRAGQEATGQEALELLVELAGTEPRFLRRQLLDVIGAMLQIAEAEGLEEGTRHLAVEFVITLAEARERAPGMVRRLPQFVGRLFAVLMRMLEDVEDDEAWHSAEVEDEDAGETSNYGVGRECLDRLAIALGGNTIVPVVSELLPMYLAAPEWQKHHAALIMLSQIAEGCSKVMPL